MTAKLTGRPVPANLKAYGQYFPAAWSVWNILRAWQESDGHSGEFTPRNLGEADGFSWDGSLRDAIIAHFGHDPGDTVRHGVGEALGRNRSGNLVNVGHGGRGAAWWLRAEWASPRPGGPGLPNFTPRRRVGRAIQPGDKQCRWCEHAEPKTAANMRAHERRDHPAESFQVAEFLCALDKDGQPCGYYCEDRTSMGRHLSASPHSVKDESRRARLINQAARQKQLAAPGSAATGDDGVTAGQDTGSGPDTSPPASTEPGLAPAELNGHAEATQAGALQALSQLAEYVRRGDRDALTAERRARQLAEDRAEAAEAVLAGLLEQLEPLRGVVNNATRS